MDRLTATDVSFLYIEGPSTPMHVGGVLVFQPPAEGFDFERLAAVVERRLALAPRFRQKIRWVPGRLANPVWVDDSAFDLGYHVRRSALPRPGSDRQLHDLVSRLISRRLDRNRPLWELYVVEGLAGGRVAVITKTHQAMVDDVGAIDLQQVLLDRSPQPRELPATPWLARREPSGATLVTRALEEAIRRPPAVVDAVRLGVNDLRTVAGRAASAVTGLARAAQLVARPAPSSPLNVPIGEQRRFAVVRTGLDSYKAIRKAHGGTINDVVLAVCAGALRGWLLSRGEPVVRQSTVRALLPVSTREPCADPPDADAGAGAGTGGRVSSFLVELPVGEPSPVLRLARISYALQGLQDSSRSVGAASLVALSGFAPPTLHALGARAAHRAGPRLFNLVITNVPGPQVPLYAAGARLSEVYPVSSLTRNTAVSIGVTSYDGWVHYGITADRDAMSDVETLAALLEEALAELVDTVR